jgi:hypothetical protein
MLRIDEDGFRILGRFRASLGTLIFHGIFIFPRENELISLVKMKNPWKISVPKLALIWRQGKRAQGSGRTDSVKFVIEILFQG